MPQDEQQQSTEGVDTAEAQLEQDSTGDERQDGSDTEGAAPADEAGETAEEPNEGLSPEALRSALTKANAEAAKTRVALRNVEKQLEDARQAGADVAAAQKVVSDLKAELAREKALRLHAVPEGLQQFVTATDEEGAIAQAKALAENVGTATPPRDTTNAGGGFSPDDDSSSIDPDALARQRIRRI